MSGVELKTLFISTTLQYLKLEVCSQTQIPTNPGSFNSPLGGTFVIKSMKIKASKVRPVDSLCASSIDWGQMLRSDSHDPVDDHVYSSTQRPIMYYIFEYYPFMRDLNITKRGRYTKNNKRHNYSFLLNRKHVFTIDSKIQIRKNSSLLSVV